jgi:hypothetical protein
MSPVRTLLLSNSHRILQLATNPSLSIFLKGYHISVLISYHVTYSHVPRGSKLFAARNPKDLTRHEVCRIESPCIKKCGEK